MAKYRRSSMAWSCSFFGASRRPLSSQQYVSISRRQSAQAPQITIRRRFSRSAVTRMPSATSLSARTTRNPSRRSASMKLAADGSTITLVISLPSASSRRSRTYSASVFCRPSRRES